MPAFVCPLARAESRPYGSSKNKIAILLILGFLANAFALWGQEIRTGVWRGRAVTYEFVNGHAIAEGDIVLENIDSSAQKDGRNEASARTGTRFLWADGIVPYTIDPELPNPQRVVAAVEHWNQVSPLRLVERTEESSYIRFVPRAGVCSSNVGMIGGGQTINLDEGCTTGAVIHEIGHAIGLFHEQSRQDRDFNVRVLMANMDRRQASNFMQHLTDGSDMGGYDFGSIMHYDSLAFSRNGNPTLETIPSGIPISQRERLSPQDLDSVRRMYGAPVQGVTISTFPFGLPVEVDGERVTTPRTFDWPEGSRHTVRALPFETGGARFRFGRWSDGGDESHTITVRRDIGVYTANMVRLHRLRLGASPVAGGRIEVSPESPDGFYPDGTLVEVRAFASEGWNFRQWSGVGYFSTHGLSPNPARFHMHAELQYTAQFNQTPVTTITTDPPGLRVKIDGVERTTPSGFAWPETSTHTVEIDRDRQTSGNGTVRYLFEGEKTLTITATNENVTHQIPVRTQYLFTRAGTVGGSVAISPASNDGFYDSGTTVELNAAPSASYRFNGWTGDVTGSDAQASVLMDDVKYVSAGFSVPRQINFLSVVNAANFLSTGSISPGEMITIFSSEIGPEELTTMQLNGGRASTSLANTRVLIDEVSAPLVYVSRDAVTAIVPYSVANKARVSVRVVRGGESTNTALLNVVPAVPALFTADSSGRGPISALNQNYSYNTAQSPAVKGSVVMLFGTGDGETNPGSVEGVVSASALARTKLPVRVRIGGLDAPVHYAGSAPGSIAGVTQINVQIPDDAPSGQVPLVVQVGEASSAQNVSLWIQ